MTGSRKKGRKLVVVASDILFFSLRGVNMFVGGRIAGNVRASTWHEVGQQSAY